MGLEQEKGECGSWGVVEKGCRAKEVRGVGGDARRGAVRKGEHGSGGVASGRGGALQSRVLLWNRVGAEKGGARELGVLVQEGCRAKGVRGGGVHGGGGCNARRGMKRGGQ